MVAYSQCSMLCIRNPLIEYTQAGGGHALHILSHCGRPATQAGLLKKILERLFRYSWGAPHVSGGRLVYVRQLSHGAQEELPVASIKTHKRGRSMVGLPSPRCPRRALPPRAIPCARIPVRDAPPCSASRAHPIRARQAHCPPRDSLRARSPSLFSRSLPCWPPSWPPHPPRRTSRTVSTPMARAASRSAPDARATQCSVPCTLLIAHMRSANRAENPLPMRAARIAPSPHGRSGTSQTR